MSFRRPHVSGMATNPNRRKGHSSPGRAEILVTVLFVCSSMVGCASSNGTIDLPVGPAVFRVEIADDPEERSKGLMHRTELGDEEGMLFVFETEQMMSFWMKNTPLPLSIAYIDERGTIREIYDMEPNSLAPVRSNLPARYALEVPQGAFHRRGVRLGHQIDLTVLNRP